MPVKVSPHLAMGPWPTQGPPLPSMKKHEEDQVANELPPNRFKESASRWGGRNGCAHLSGTNQRGNKQSTSPNAASAANRSFAPPHRPLHLQYLDMHKKCGVELLPPSHIACARTEHAPCSIRRYSINIVPDCAKRSNLPGKISDPSRKPARQLHTNTIANTNTAKVVFNLTPRFQDELSPTAQDDLIM